MILELKKDLRRHKSKPVTPKRIGLGKQSYAHFTPWRGLVQTLAGYTCSRIQRESRVIGAQTLAKLCKKDIRPAGAAACGTLNHSACEFPIEHKRKAVEKHIREACGVKALVRHVLVWLMLLDPSPA